MKSTVAAPIGGGKVDARGEAFAARLSQATKGRKLAVVARAIGVAPSTMQRYLGGSMPAADIGIRLARELDVQFEWLIEGIGGRDVGGAPEDSVVLPRYDINFLREYGKPDADDLVTIPRSWLGRVGGSASGLWLTEMPGDAMPDVASAGQAIVCKDPEQPLQDGRVYIFLLDGRLLARRVLIRPDGLLLKAGDPAIDPMQLGPDQLEQFIPVARVIAAIDVKTA